MSNIRFEAVMVQESDNGSWDTMGWFSSFSMAENAARDWIERNGAANFSLWKITNPEAFNIDSFMGDELEYVEL